MRAFSLERLRRLTPADWSAGGQAWLALLAVDLGLRLLSFPRVDRLFTLRRVRTPPATPELAEATAARLAWATRAAARRHLWPMPCLPQSLCLRWLLARRGIAAELRLGVAREEGRLTAHAWVEIDGRPLGEAAESPSRFAPLAE
jgi:hypothetical protein